VHGDGRTDAYSPYSQTHTGLKKLPFTSPISQALASSSVERHVCHYHAVRCTAYRTSLAHTLSQRTRPPAVALVEARQGRRRLGFRRLCEVAQVGRGGRGLAVGGTQVLGAVAPGGGVGGWGVTIRRTHGRRVKGLRSGLGWLPGAAGYLGG